MKISGDFKRDGYVVADLGLHDSLIEQVKHDVLNAPAEYRTQSDHERDDNPRIFHLWKHSAAVKRLALHPRLLQAVWKVTGKRPLPFQTLNFRYGTQQALHQDSIHFDAEPGGHMVGTWVALENIRSDAGPLLVVPGSHKLGRLDLADFGIPTPDYQHQMDAYRQYERALAGVVEGKPIPVLLPKGQALIWHGNLVHGGSAITTPGATRWSQATHMWLEGYTRLVCPMLGTEKAAPELAA